jgi:hypothetical protein
MRRRWSLCANSSCGLPPTPAMVHVRCTVSPRLRVHPVPQSTPRPASHFSGRSLSIPARETPRRARAHVCLSPANAGHPPSCGTPPSMASHCCSPSEHWADAVAPGALPALWRLAEALLLRVRSFCSSWWSRSFAVRAPRLRAPPAPGAENGRGRRAGRCDVAPHLRLANAILFSFPCKARSDWPTNVRLTQHPAPYCVCDECSCRRRRAAPMCRQSWRLPSGSPRPSARAMASPVSLRLHCAGPRQVREAATCRALARRDSRGSCRERRHARATEPRRSARPLLAVGHVCAAGEERWQTLCVRGADSSRTGPGAALVGHVRRATAVGEAPLPTSLRSCSVILCQAQPGPCGGVARASRHAQVSAVCLADSLAPPTPRVNSARWRSTPRGHLYPEQARELFAQRLERLQVAWPARRGRSAHA